MDLRTFFQAHPAVAVAFSGGVDSAYLLQQAKAHGAKVVAYYVHSAFQPAFELKDAKDTAEFLRVPLRILEVDVLSQETVVKNEKNRCYHCKKVIFSTILAAARQDGFSVLLDGSNFDDDPSDRPGMVALQELEVLSPLRLVGLTKADVRRGAKEAGLTVWNKPAYACLATRIPTGRAITENALFHVEQGESLLFSLGFTDFRLRLVAEGAKLQLRADQLSLFLEKRETILEQLQPYFQSITLDLTTRGQSEEQPTYQDTVWELSCNLDDMTGEHIAFATEHLLSQGALDVWTTPIMMKKGRPAVILSVLCKPEAVACMEREILRHTTTLGVRRHSYQRTVLPRSTETVQTPYGDVTVKSAPGKSKPEYEDVANLAKEHNVPIFQIKL